MHLRPYHHTDLSAAADIIAAANVNDPLCQYMNPHMFTYWTSYRLGALRYIQKMHLELGKVFLVAETDEHDEQPAEAPQQRTPHRGGQVVGWAVFHRTGKSAVARNWRRLNDSWANLVERALLTVQNDWYASRSIFGVDWSCISQHRRNILPTLEAGFDADIFAEAWEVDGVCVLPSWHRRGIGGLLLKWVVEQARAEGVPAVVMSSPVGRRMYEKGGFQFLNVVNFGPFIVLEDGKECAQMVFEPTNEGRWLGRAREKIKQEQEEKERKQGREDTRKRS